MSRESVTVARQCQAAARLAVDEYYVERIALMLARHDLHRSTVRLTQLTSGQRVEYFARARMALGLHSSVH